MSAEEDDVEYPPLDVKSVTIRRVWNLGDYENISIQATANVGQDEDASAVCRELRRWIDREGPKRSRWGRWTLEPEEPEQAPYDPMDREMDEQQ